MDNISVVGNGAPLKDAPKQGTESAVAARLSESMTHAGASNQATTSNEAVRLGDGAPHEDVPNRTTASVEEVIKGAHPSKGSSRASAVSGAKQGMVAQGPRSLAPRTVVAEGWKGMQRVNPTGVNLSAPPPTSGPLTGVRMPDQACHPKSSKTSSTKRRERALRRQQQVSGTAVPTVETSDTSKRAREVSGESPGTSGVTKRPKSHGESYREALTGVKMAVIADDHPVTPLGVEMLNPVRGALWELLEATPDPLPHVSLGKWTSGAIHFTCEGEDAAKWLCRLNGTTVGEVKLKVVNARDLPKPVKMAWKSRNTWSVDTEIGRAHV